MWLTTVVASGRSHKCESSILKECATLMIVSRLQATDRPHSHGCFRYQQKSTCVIGPTWAFWCELQKKLNRRPHAAFTSRSSWQPRRKHVSRQEVAVCQGLRLFWRNEIEGKAIETSQDVVDGKALVQLPW